MLIQAQEVNKKPKGPFLATCRATTIFKVLCLQENIVNSFKLIFIKQAKILENGHPCHMYGTKAYQ